MSGIELGFSELPAAVSASFASLPPELIYRREKERRARLGADAAAAAMEEARREFAAMLAADRPKGTGGRPAKNGRPKAVVPAAGGDDELESGPESHETEEVSLAGVAVGEEDEVVAEELEEGDQGAAVEEHEEEAEVVVAATRPAPARTRGGRPAAKPAGGRGKATPRPAAPAPARRRKPTRPAAPPARSRRGDTVVAGSAGRRGSSTSSRGGARGGKR